MINEHEHVAREEKARRLAEWLIADLDRFEEEVGESRFSVRESFISTLAEASDEWWAQAAAQAGTNPPSELTRRIVVAKLRTHYEAAAPADPFEGVNGR